MARRKKLFKANNDIYHGKNAWITVISNKSYRINFGEDDENENDDEDSNEEKNWRNDYPDEDFEEEDYCNDERSTVLKANFADLDLLDDENDDNDDSDWNNMIFLCLCFNAKNLMWLLFELFFLHGFE